MATELATDNSKWEHKKDAYTVTVEHSAPQGVTLFRRDAPLLVRTTSGKDALIAKLRTKKTKYFLREFKKL